MGVTGFSHVGLSVTDADRSLEFYTSALDFQVGARHELGADFKADNDDFPPLPLVCQFVTLDDLHIALLQYPEPEVPAGQRPVYRVGIVNIGLLVDAIEPVAKKIEAYGGQLIRETLLESEQGTFLHCLDPDGARIELMCMRD
ncbi:hypothetical protein MB02_10580 [Croceicoccus estronivorus]|uniref:VOC family protein n=1 Tax=Croceicoccus estronivorus TaxID=1172626 RepID=UPI000830D0A2|nr:VOC family protein [Croceicoccus estronivorus]OCC23607.1 hypothetical protein MB02_10580 [Croceicoccus estronivorus]